MKPTNDRVLEVKSQMKKMTAGLKKAQRGAPASRSSAVCAVCDILSITVTNYQFRSRPYSLCDTAHHSIAIPESWSQLDRRERNGKKKNILQQDFVTNKTLYLVVNYN